MLIAALVVQMLLASGASAVCAQSEAPAEALATPRPADGASPGTSSEREVPPAETAGVPPRAEAPVPAPPAAAPATPRGYTPSPPRGYVPSAGPSPEASRATPAAFLDAASVARFERRMRRSQRVAFAFAPFAIVGGLGGILSNTCDIGSPCERAGLGLFAVGYYGTAALSVGRAIAALRAARVLRDRGVRVRRWAGFVAVFTAPLVIPSLIFGSIQMRANRRARASVAGDPLEEVRPTGPLRPAPRPEDGFESEEDFDDDFGVRLAPDAF